MKTLILALALSSMPMAAFAQTAPQVARPGTIEPNEPVKLVADGPPRQLINFPVVVNSNKKAATR